MNEYTNEAWIVQFIEGNWVAFLNADAAWKCYEYWGPSRCKKPPFPAVTPKDEPVTAMLDFELQNPRITNQFCKVFLWKGKAVLARALTSPPGDVESCHE